MDIAETAVELYFVILTYNKHHHNSLILPTILIYLIVVLMSFKINGGIYGHFNFSKLYWYKKSWHFVVRLFFTEHFNTMLTKASPM